MCLMLITKAIKVSILRVTSTFRKDPVTPRAGSARADDDIPPADSAVRFG